MMIDQAVSEGKYIDFMGIPAKTSFAIANIAIKYNALIIPAYAIRKEENEPIQVIIEPSLNISNQFKIIEKLNKSLENIIRKYPSQWYWVHNRWKWILGLINSPKIKIVYEQPEALEHTIASEGTVIAVSAQPLMIKIEDKAAKIRYFFIIILIGINKYGVKIDYM